MSTWIGRPAAAVLGRCLTAGLLILLMVLGSAVGAYAQSASPTPSCYITPIPYSLLTGQHAVETYETRIATPAPARVLAPGESFPVNIRVNPKCAFDCFEVSPHSLKIRMRLGKSPGRSAWIRQGTQVGTVGFRTFDCDFNPTRQLTIKAPDPLTLGSSGDVAEEFVTLGICPDDVRFPCAKQLFRVRVGSVGGWRVGAPSPAQRALGDGPLRQPAGRELSFKVRVTNGSSRVLWEPNRAFVRLDQVSGPQVSDRSAFVKLGSVGARKTVTKRILLPALGPGRYSFRACIGGLQNTAGAFEAEHCGKAVDFRVGSSAAVKFLVTPVTLGVNGAPSGERFSVSAIARNRSGFPLSGPFSVRLDYWPRGTDQRLSVVARPIANFARAQRSLLSFTVPALDGGVYMFRACLVPHGQTETAQVCGTPARITVGAKSGSATTGAGQVPCRGGTVRNGRCVCPAGMVYNPNPGFKRCYRCAAGRAWDAGKKRCVRTSAQKSCPAGQVRVNGRCRQKANAAGAARKCGRGARYVKGRGCVCPRGRRYDAKLQRCVRSARTQRCEQSRRKADGTCCAVGRIARGNRCLRRRPAARKCRRPFVFDRSRQACVCPRGFRKIGNRCRKIAKRQPATGVCPDRKRRLVSGRCCPKGTLARQNRCIRRN
ncbi:MAG: hypothetical protein AAF441_19260 [Pseudomonadota bacterium]